MPKFRKKPVVIEAFQLTAETRASNENWPAWMHEAWNEPAGSPGALMASPEGPAITMGPLFIATLEGVMKVSFGDWIIRGVKGELYPCKPDIFEATYQPERGDVVTPEQAAARISAAEPKPLFERMTFAATCRCECGAGMAYDPTSAGAIDSVFKGASQWECSDILRFNTLPAEHQAKVKAATHTSPLPFAMYEVKSEGQPSANGQTTRPSDLDDVNGRLA